MTEKARRSNFLTDIIDADLKAGKNEGQVVTRFPPEPNGFLHIGHAKSILLNFGLARQYGGKAHLRFDDTNPTTEDTQYVESIQADARWLGAGWGKNLFYASDYFERMHGCAVRLIEAGKAYVDSQSVEALREQRGSFDKPGSNSPFRNRSVQENLELFRKMRAGELDDGSCVLRAKIDMAHPNVLMRDPLLYRIRHAHHHRTGDKWPIYPMYDYAHPLEDAFEGITHSICTLEFESNRELYDWVLDNLGPWKVRPRQYEFARLALGYTVMSKRKLLQLVNEKRVSGWDDPRMPTIAGMRRRGVTPDALRDFAELIGVAKNNSTVDIGKLEFAIRNDLEGRTPRALAVLHPLKVTLTNYPAGKSEELDVAWWPGEPERGGSRKVPFSGSLLIERDDFSASPPADWKRLAPGKEVRLIGAYIIRCDEVIRNAAGDVVELRCSYDAESKSGESTKKVNGTLHWVDAVKSLKAPVRLYDRLFTVEQPDAAEGDFLQHLNPASLVPAPEARVEPALSGAKAEDRYQFLRTGYFFVDPVESRSGVPVFNRIISLKDTWGKPAAQNKGNRAEKKPAKVASSTPRKGRAEARAEQRATNPELAKRFKAYQDTHRLEEGDADLLTAELSVSDYFDAAVAGGAAPASAAKWLLNDLSGLADDLVALPLKGADFGRFVKLVDSGRVTSSAGKTLLAYLVKEGGDAEAAVKQLGLEKVNDTGVIDAAVAKVLTAQSAEVTRYRAGEKKLFGVLLGAVMRETGGAADAASVRKALTDKLG
ncbi:MAG: glutamine--tRNA ligase/YqeY domain fusion protein [Myxococcaceae bacterium]